MDIQRSCALSPLIDHTKPNLSTPRNPPPSIFSFESTMNDSPTLHSTPLMNIPSSTKAGLLDDQFRLERSIKHEMSIQTESSFVTTYTSVQMILSQMQLKLATVFLQETEYLKSREQQLAYDEQSLTKRLERLKTIQNERQELEKDFHQLKDRLENAVIQVTKFQTNGTETLRNLFHESHKIDEQLSGLICQSIASLNRSRTMIQARLTDFSHRSNQIHSILTHKQVWMQSTQSSITLLLELVNTLNQLNNQHAQEIFMTTIDFEKQSQQVHHQVETTNNHWDIYKQMKEINVLEKEKIQLEKEFLEQTILLENISTIIGTAIIR